jgi:hypothetical protein
MRRIRTLAIVAVIAAAQLFAAPAGADDVNVTPSTNGMPAGQTIQKMLSWIAQGALFASVASIFIGAAIWGLSKLFGSYSGGHRGMTLTLGGCVGALIVGIGPQLVNMFFRAS